MSDLHIKYRPQRLKDIIGQNDAVTLLQNYFKNGGLPHCLMLVGPSGVGKTTIARILARRLGCIGNDFCEINCADKDGPDQIRNTLDFIRLSPNGKSRVRYMDEFQALSRAGFAQQSLLKIMEDSDKYPHAYFIIAATDPSKIIKTIHTRCKKVVLNSVSEADLVTLINRVAGEEGKQVTERVAAALAEASEGSPRQALILLGQVLIIDNEADQLEAITKSEAQKQAFDLAKALFWEKPDTKKIMEIAARLEAEDAESVRQMVLKCCRKELLKGGKAAARAYVVYDAFRDDYYTTGFTGLVASCFRIAAGI